MSTSAGRVLIIPKGDYNAATTYAMLDMVYYNGSSYVCKQPSTGNLPTNTTYWQLMTGDISAKMDKANPTGTGSFSLNRKANTTIGSNSFAEGSNTTASGSKSHAEGETTIASGEASHAEGQETTASGDYSHAEGTTNVASGYGSHAEGLGVTASGVGSHAEGNYTIAGRAFQHVCGKNNDNKANTLFEVGNGADPEIRSNAFEVYSDGTLSTDNGTTKVKLETLVSQNQALTNQLSDETKTRAALGAHNLLPPFASQTSDGIIFTVDANGVVDIDGESTSTYSETRVNFKLKAGTYTLSGIPSAGYGNSKLIIFLADLDHNTEVARDIGSGATFTLASDTNMRAFIYAYRAYGDFDHVKVYPMIRLATDSDPTYQTYAKTNVELTQSKADKSQVDGNMSGSNLYRFFTFSTQNWRAYSTIAEALAAKASEIFSTEGIYVISAYTDGGAPHIIIGQSDGNGFYGVHQSYTSDPERIYSNNLTTWTVGR